MQRAKHVKKDREPPRASVFRAAVECDDKLPSICMRVTYRDDGVERSEQKHAGLADARALTSHLGHTRPGVGVHSEDANAQERD